MSFEDNDYTSINVVPVVDLTDKLRTDRLEQLLSKYASRFGASGGPQFIVRVPGRVNLIGEHIDYCGYSVFPMALRQDILMAVGSNDSGSEAPRLQLANTQPTSYSEAIIESSTDVDFPKSIKWYHYFLCGYKGVLDKYCSAAEDECPPFNVMVDGSIPPGSGLSSSSAMVVASALSTLVAYYNSLGKLFTLSVDQILIKTLLLFRKNVHPHSKAGDCHTVHQV